MVDVRWYDAMLTLLVWDGSGDYRTPKNAATAPDAPLLGIFRCSSPSLIDFEFFLKPPPTLLSRDCAYTCVRVCRVVNSLYNLEREYQQCTQTADWRVDPLTQRQVKRKRRFRNVLSW